MSTDSNPSSTDLAKDAAPDIAGKTESEPDATTESGIQSSEVPAVPATEGGLEGRDSQASNDTDVPVEEGKEGDSPVPSGDAGEGQEGRDSQDSQVSQAIPDEGAADATSTAVPPSDPVPVVPESSQDADEKRGSISQIGTTLFDYIIGTPSERLKTKIITETIVQEAEEKVTRLIINKEGSKCSLRWHRGFQHLIINSPETQFKKC